MEYYISSNKKCVVVSSTRVYWINYMLIHRDPTSSIRVHWINYILVIRNW